MMTTTAESPMKKRNHIQNVALFLASPFIGLYYAVVLPGKLLQLAMAERKQAKESADVSK
ncbi:MAG TPA: hypothetical protein VLQ47_03675 [Rhodoferax sp.]|nr:hypothetical protein [Rhodoferax sp.]